jgi:hypothetical protein
MNGAQRGGRRGYLSELLVSLRGEGWHQIKWRWLTGGGARGQEEDCTGSQAASDQAAVAHQRRCSGSKKMAWATAGGLGGRAVGGIGPTGGGSPEAVLGVEEEGARNFGKMSVSKSNRWG